MQLIKWWKRAHHLRLDAEVFHKICEVCASQAASKFCKRKAYALPCHARSGQRSTRFGESQPGPSRQVGLVNGTVPPGVTRCEGREGFFVPSLSLRNPGSGRKRARVDDQVFARTHRPRSKHTIQMETHDEVATP